MAIERSEASVPTVPAAMVSNQFFDEFTARVREKPIPWEGYSRAGLISGEDLQELKRFQQQLADRSVENKELSAYVPVLVRLAERVSSIDALQYLLVVMDELVESDQAAVEVLRNGIVDGTVLHTMIRCMEKKDDYLGLKACKVLIGVAAGAESAEKVVGFGRIFAYLEKCLKSELTSVVDVALQVMQSALRVRRARSVLYNDAAPCLAQMVDVLKRSHGATGAASSSPGHNGLPRASRGVVAASQMQYEVVFCLWLLTFERAIAATLNRKYDVIPVMVDIARSAVKEKVIRVIVATWANMLEQGEGANVPNMLVAKVPGCLATLSAGRNFKDEDLREGIRQLAENMAAHTGVMTTWDEYVNEVASGKLEWAPAHRSEQFWKLHVQKMDTDDHRVVRQLAAVLASPTASETALAVACHDLSQYVKYNPDGKRLLARIGAKTRIMALMTSEYPEVRYEALMCVQQIMLNAWRN